MLKKGFLLKSSLFSKKHNLTVIKSIEPRITTRFLNDNKEHLIQINTKYIENINSALLEYGVHRNSITSIDSIYQDSIILLLYLFFVLVFLAEICLATSILFTPSNHPQPYTTNKLISLAAVACLLSTLCSFILNLINTYLITTMVGYNQSHISKKSYFIPLLLSCITHSLTGYTYGKGKYHNQTRILEMTAAGTMIFISESAIMIAGGKLIKKIGQKLIRKKEQQSLKKIKSSLIRAGYTTMLISGFYRNAIDNRANDTHVSPPPALITLIPEIVHLIKEYLPSNIVKSVVLPPFKYSKRYPRYQPIHRAPSTVTDNQTLTQPL